MMTQPTVLVCDDEPTVGAALRRALEPHAVDVLIDTSSDALHLAQHFQPQAILLDLLQWRDGLAMLKELKADPSTREIPVIIMSGLFTEADAPEAVCPGRWRWAPWPSSPSRSRSRSSTRSPASSRTAAAPSPGFAARRTSTSRSRSRSRRQLRSPEAFRLVTGRSTD